MAAATFAMESMTLLTASLVDRAESDFRLESAICKMLASEWAWKIANDTMQIRGGRGYETVASLAKRGESPDPVERIVRDSRINTIFEVKRNYAIIHREGGARPAFEISARFSTGGCPFPCRAAGLRAAVFTACGILQRFFHGRSGLRPSPPQLSRWCRSCARKLARRMFANASEWIGGWAPAPAWRFRGYWRRDFRNVGHIVTCAGNGGPFRS
jgi:hypothetical protein